MATKTTTKKKQTFTTPKGLALFAHVKEVDYGTEKYPNKDGGYSITLILDADQSEALKAKLKDEIAEAREKAEEAFGGLKKSRRDELGKLKFSDVCKTEYDKDDEPTGNFRWLFKTHAFYKDRNTGTKKPYTVPVFDGFNQPVKLPTEIGNGSVVRVNFSVAPYFVEGQGMGGLSLYLNAVQIIKLVQFGQKNAEAYGFEEDDEAEEFESAVDEETSADGLKRGSEDDDTDVVPF